MAIAIISNRQKQDALYLFRHAQHLIIAQQYV